MAHIGGMRLLEGGDYSGLDVSGAALIRGNTVLFIIIM